MAYKTKVFNSLNITRDAKSNSGEETSDLAELMANPEYLRYSSSIINDALKDGFDVLQLPNGDIITTGTKIITNTYVWDAESNALTKARAGGNAKRARKAKAESGDAE
jgi:ATP-dependent DNA ligase